MFYALRNLRDQVTFEIDKPWEQWGKFPVPKNIKERDTLVKWRMKPATKHAFISGIAGLDPRVRVTKPSGKHDELANPPQTMHAVIVDYDAACREADVRNVLENENPPSEYYPNFICDSFRPGHKRLVWLFDQPLTLTGHFGATLAFTKSLARHIGARHWLPGFDESSTNPGQYFSIGTNWVELSPLPIPHHVLSHWASVAESSVTFASGAIAPPPIEKLAQLVEDRFPGRWPGSFDLGQRGPVFFMSDANNPTSAVVFPEGMRTFSTGTKGFYTWEEIFGSRTIDELRGETQGIWRDKVVWAQDTGKYWLQLDHKDEWRPLPKDGITDFLVCTAGMSSRPPKGGGGSQVTNFLNQVRINNAVEEALPFVFHPQGRMFYNGSWVLNTSRVRVLAPAPPLTGINEDFHEAGERRFPWLYKFLTGFFCPVRHRPKWVPEEIPLEEVQLWHFLAWVYRFYVPALAQKPLPGQAVVVGGIPGRGKGLLSNGILGRLMGGHSESARFFVNDEQWTSEILKCPIMTIDDDTTADDVKSHRVYTTKLKRMVANAQATYNKKYGSAGRVQWLGRVIITCNLDPDSLRILPDMNQGNADKIMLFQAGEGKPLEDMNQINEILDRELPHFARWLCEWRVPSWLLAGDERFWVRPYHHVSLLEAATEQGSAINMLEMLREVYDLLCDSSDEAVIGNKIVPLGDKRYEWRGPVRQLYRLMRTMEVAHVDRMNMQQIGTLLGVLASRGFNINRVVGSGTDWTIVFDRDLLRQKKIVMDGHSDEGESDE